MDLAQREKFVHLLFEAFEISEEKWGDIHVKDVAAHLIENGVSLPILCGECVHSTNSHSIDCAYKCGCKQSPCYGRITYADFGCLYGKRREGE